MRQGNGYRTVETQAFDVSLQRFPTFDVIPCIKWRSLFSRLLCFSTFVPRDITFATVMSIIRVVESSFFLGGGGSRKGIFLHPPYII